MNRFGGGKIFNLPREPVFGVGARLRIMVQAQNERADFFVAAVAVDFDQILNGERKFVFAFVMRIELFVQRFIGKQARLAFVQNGKLRVEAEFVEMFADKLEAKAVQRADVRGVEQRQLFRQNANPEFSRDFFSSASRRRCFISVAAASVKVTIKISSSETFSSQIKFRQRSTSVCVLPVPAPAMTRTLPRARTAFI